MSELKELDCQIALSFNWLNLLPSDFRSCFQYGVFNAHPGDLPKYKGNACPNWAMINGDEKIVIAVHEMVDELDSGDIALKSSLEINENTYI